jgi:hypothetical protein
MSTFLIDVYESRVTKLLNEFDFRHHYDMVLVGRYERHTIREMLVQLIHWLKLKKDNELVPEVHSMYMFISDEDESQKLTTDHLLFMLARAEWMYRRKPTTPNAMYQ